MAEALIVENSAVYSCQLRRASIEAVPNRNRGTIRRHHNVDSVDRSEFRRGHDRPDDPVRFSLKSSCQKTAQRKDKCGCTNYLQMMRNYEIYLSLAGTNLGEKIDATKYGFQFMIDERGLQILDVTPDAFFRTASEELPSILIQDIHQQVIETIPIWTSPLWSINHNSHNDFDSFFKAVWGGWSDSEGGYPLSY